MAVFLTMNQLLVIAPLGNSKNKWEYEPGDFCEQDHFNLMQLFSSKMSNIEFNKLYGMLSTSVIIISTKPIGIIMVVNFLQWAILLRWHALNACIVASHELVRRFKRGHNVQIVNTVFLTDGDSGRQDLLS